MTPHRPARTGAHVRARARRHDDHRGMFAPPRARVGEALALPELTGRELADLVSLRRTA
ncbi:hypothetical protein [Streptomyces sp. NPDC046821]|uniref:hypothetical protein n=1 Tax=Streptomyces sp. NPDC046821 TaxID=3154702 RepID=UPI0033D39150